MTVWRGCGTSLPDLSLQTLRDYPGQVKSVAVSDDGRRVVSFQRRIPAAVSSTSTGPTANGSRASRGMSANTNHTLTPDGTRVVVPCEDGFARVFDVESGEVAMELKGHEAGVNSAVVSPDGTLVLTASDDRTARLWDARSGTSLHTLSGHPDPVVTAIFSPKGSRIATYSRKDPATREGTVFVWDAQGERLSSLDGKVGGLSPAAFSPDGLFIVVSAEGTPRSSGTPGRASRGEEARWAYELGDLASSRPTAPGRDGEPRRDGKALGPDDGTLTATLVSWPHPPVEGPFCADRRPAGHFCFRY